MEWHGMSRCHLRMPKTSEGQMPFRDTIGFTQGLFVVESNQVFLVPRGRRWRFTNKKCFPVFNHITIGKGKTQKRNQEIDEPCVPIRKEKIRIQKSTWIRHQNPPKAPNIICAYTCYCREVLLYCLPSCPFKMCLVVPFTHLSWSVGALHTFGSVRNLLRWTRWTRCAEQGSNVCLGIIHLLLLFFLGEKY